MSCIASATWRRLDVPGTDTCRLVRTADGWALEGRAVFDERGPADISYRVDCAPDWATRTAMIEGTHAGAPVAIRIVKNDGNWRINEKVDPAPSSLIDIDFGFTPATNFLLMRRLAYPTGVAISVTVAWFDLGEECLTQLPQRYTRRGDRSFFYESPTVNYSGTLILAPNGFVETYPGLWSLEAAS